jgi:hypothetical protein
MMNGKVLHERGAKKNGHLKDLKLLCLSEHYVAEKNSLLSIEECGS